jgi:hypothetical protein
MCEISGHTAVTSDGSERWRIKSNQDLSANCGNSEMHCHSFQPTSPTTARSDTFECVGILRVEHKGVRRLLVLRWCAMSELMSVFLKVYAQL